MRKSICALVHKPGSTREQFQRYYEDNHAPLAVGLFPFTRYVRNHLVDPGDFGWDTISEFWADDISHAASLMQGPVGDTMRADEARFMDRSRIAPGGAEEEILSAGDPADPLGRRTCLLIEADPGSDPYFAAHRLAGNLARDHAGVSIDIIAAWQDPAFPAAAVVWLAGWPTVNPVSFGLHIRVLRAMRVETPRSALLAQMAGS